jgi:nitroreductase
VTDLSSVMRARRSVRHFRDQPADESLIVECIQEARWAPSGGNEQPWSVSVVSPNRTRTLLQRLEAPIWEAMLPRIVEMRRRMAGEEAFDESLAAARNMIAETTITRGSPSLLLVWNEHQAVDPELMARVNAATNSSIRLSEALDAEVAAASVAGFALSLALIAESRGLATCIQYTWKLVEQELKADLRCEDRRLESALLIGLPARSTDRGPPRRPVSVDFAP